MTLPGFPEDNSTQIHIPEQFFRQVLFEIDNLDELKLTLYIFWRLDRMEGPVHYIRFTHLLEDSKFIQSIHNKDCFTTNLLIRFSASAVNS